ncbi:MAG: TonB-dependent receptor plug domain-containing protein [Flavobacteriales bacterium]|nr:TonB-dependent receptor plug domain-containing protein [Flavobacteriales bacterium]
MAKQRKSAPKVRIRRSQLIGGLESEMKQFVLILIASFGLLSSKAQTGVDTLSEAIVKPGPWPAQASGTRQNIVVRGKDLDDLPVRDLSDLMRFLPGVEIQARGPFGTQADISMRGSTFNQILVLIDGMEVNDPLTGHFNMNLPVLLGDIEQIEIIKGPASALYGPDAVGGVILIRTKSFEPERMKRASLRADLTGGAFGLAGAELIGFFGNGGALGGKVLRSDGQPLNGADAPSYFRQFGATSARIFQWKSGLMLKVRFSYDFRDFDARYYYTQSTLDQSREEVERTWVQSSLEKMWNNGAQTIWSTAMAITTDSFIFNPQFTPNAHTAITQRTRILHRFEANNGSSFQVGADGEFVQVRSNDRGDHQLAHGGAFGIWSYRPNNTWTLQLSSRLDLEKAYGLKWVPQADISRDFGRWSAFASAGRSIRSADLTERYVSTNLPGPLSGRRNLGNPELGTEDAWSWEAGLRSSHRAPIWISGSAFLRNSRQLIDYVLTPGNEIPTASNVSDTLSYFYAGNLGKLDLAGVDLALNMHYQRAAFSARGSLGYVLLRQLNDQQIASKYLASYARDQISVQGTLKYKKVYLGFQGLHKKRDAAYVAAINRTLDPDYFVINSGLGTYLWRDRIDWSVQCLNILNRKYSDILGAPMPERWVYMRLIVHLKKGSTNTERRCQE